MVQYVRKNVPLISKELMSIDDVEAFVARAEYSVVGRFIDTAMTPFHSLSYVEFWFFVLLVMGLFSK